MTVHLFPTSRTDDTRLFSDPIIGTPLSFHVHADVKDKDALESAIWAHGGSTTTNYSAATYILVDPKADSGQSLWRQYSSNKKKVILDARWAWACVHENRISGHNSNWGGFKLNGTEQQTVDASTSTATPPIAALTLNERDTRRASNLSRATATPPSTPQTVPDLPGGGVASSSQESQNPFILDPTSGSFFLPPDIDDPASLMSFPSQMLLPGAFSGLSSSWTWSGSLDFGNTGDIGGNQNGYVPSWDEQARSFNAGMFFNDNAPFPLTQHEPFGPYYFPPSQTSTPQLAESLSSTPLEIDAPPPLPLLPDPPPQRPLKRKQRNPSVSEAGPSSLIQPAAPERSSPTPPTRAVMSAHGGNVFTDEDVAYLHNYISYCKDIGSMLSLREICEKLAIKAPHHSFFSWRRYCNKHKIQLGAYTTDGSAASAPPCPLEDQPSTNAEDEDGHSGSVAHSTGAADAEPPTFGETASHCAFVLIAGTGGQLRYRQHPSPDETNGGLEDHAVARTDSFFQEEEPEAPKALYLSKSGKGIAFTQADVEYLVRFISFRRHESARDGLDKSDDQDEIAMPRLLSEISEKAPHHSRASWMKYWRRHKHELEYTEGSFPGIDARPRPAPNDSASSSISGSSPLVLVGSPAPRKRQRYSRTDDVLIARFFASRPLPTPRSKGKSPEDKEMMSQDAIFREFAQAHPEHPWKGWQEHYRMHKVEIEHLIAKLGKGEDIE